MIWINLKKKELTKKRTFIKNNWYDWYDWLINYIPQPLKKTAGGVKDQIMSLFKTKVYSKSKCVKSAYGGGRKQSEDNAIKSIRNRFKLKKENEAIKDRIIRDIRTLFKQEDDYYKPIKVRNFWNNNYIEYESSGDRNKSYQ